MQGFDSHNELEGLREFRDKVKRVREENRLGWEGTKKLVSPRHLNQTLCELGRNVQQSSLASSLKEFIIKSLPQATVERTSQLPTERLKELTGLPATKAVRALCLAFEVGSTEVHASIRKISPAQIEETLRESANPYDLLLEDESPSLLDLGAGDLTFEQELVDLYLPKLRKKGQPLILHAVDRLRAGSQVGGVYHVDSQRRKHLQDFPDEELQFRFWGGVDLADLANLKGMRPHYTMVTCQAPANPTFALEPTRLSQEIIHAHLTKTRGEFRKGRVGKEDVLEVFHEGRVLTFPPWKFEVIGPLALLDIMTRWGALCVLSSMDDEVFWETLAQLLADERYRPRDVIFSPNTVKEIFGSIHTELSQLPIGGRIRLSELCALRNEVPRVITQKDERAAVYSMRYVEVRRGATFEGIPSSFTARQFSQMKEEKPPWWIILVPGGEKTRDTGALPCAPQL